MGVHQVPIQGYGPVIGGQRLDRTVEIAERRAAAQVRRRVVRGGGDGLIEDLQGFVPLRHLRQNLGAAIEGVQKVGAMDCGTIVAVCGVLQPAQVLQPVAAIEPGFAIGRVQGDGAVVARHCIRRAAEGAERIAAIEPRLHMVGLDSDGAVIAGDRLGGAAKVLQRHAAIVVGEGAGGIDRQGPVQITDAVLEVLALDRGYARHLQGVEMVRLSLQDIAIEALGVGDPAGPVKGERLLEGLFGIDGAEP